MFASAESKHPRLTNGGIISEEFQPTCVITIHQHHVTQTDRRTDRRHEIALKRIAR